MSDIELTRTIEKVKAAATRCNDNIQDSHDEDDPAMICLIRFCDALLGQGTVDDFMRSYGMDQY